MMKRLRTSRSAITMVLQLTHTVAQSQSQMQSSALQALRPLRLPKAKHLHLLQQDNLLPIPRLNRP